MMALGRSVPPVDRPVPLAAHAARFCPVLRTPRLCLTPRLGSDAARLHAPLQDDRLYQWISMTPPTEAERERTQAHWRRLESRLSPDERELWLAWVITRSTGDEPLGVVDADVAHEADGGWVSGNLGYYMFPPHWGQGLATEAVQAVVTHLLQQSVRRIHATVTVGNQPSARLLARIGFALERRLPRNDCIRGVWVDDDEYVLHAAAGHAIHQKQPLGSPGAPI